MNSFTSSSDPAPRPLDRRRAMLYLGALGCAAMIAFAAAWLYVALMPIAFLSRDYPVWLAKKAMLDSCDLGVVAVFGDSRALAAVVPDEMPVRVSNFALSGTGPIETYFTVQRALRCPTLPKLVIIAHSLAPFMDDPRFWTEGPLIGFLNYPELRDIDTQASRLNDQKVRGDGGNNGLPPALRDWLYTKRFPPFYFASLVNGYGLVRWSHNRNAFKDILAARGHALFGTADGSSELAPESEVAAFRPSPLTDYYFSKTIELLKQHGVETFFLAMPVNRSTYDAINPRVINAMQTYLQGKEREFNNFYVAGNVVTCWPDRLFGDEAHLNARGAANYSHELGAWLGHAVDGDSGNGLSNRCA